MTIKSTKRTNKVNFEAIMLVLSRLKAKNENLLMAENIPTILNYIWYYYKEFKRNP